MNVITFLISFALFCFGLWVMSIAVDVAGAEAAVFLSGILAVSFSLAIPFHLLGKADGA